MKKEKTFWGIVLICIAALLVLNGLGFWWSPHFNVATVVLAIIFGFCLVKSIVDRSLTGIIFSAAFLYLTVDEPLHIQYFSAWTVLLVACLLSIGCSLLSPHRRQVPSFQDEDGAHFDNVIDEPDQDTIHFENMFSSSIKYINSDHFVGAYLKCTFGGMKVYFDNTIVQGTEAYVDLDVSFGGVELYVPRTWKVVNHARATFGGVEEKNQAVPNGSPTLYLTGNVSFGGVTVFYV